MEAEGDIREGSTKDSWYIVVTLPSWIGENAVLPWRKEPLDYVVLIDYDYVTSRRAEIENRDGAWWIPYDSEERCWTASSWIAAMSLQDRKTCPFSR